MLKPVLQALLLADHVYDDKLTGKKVIAGTFNMIVVGQIKPKEAADGKTVSIPGGMSVGSPYAYFSLTDVVGRLDLDMRYVDLTDHKVLLKAGIAVQCEDRLATIEGVLPMPALPTPHPGVYALELLCSDELIGSLRVTVKPFDQEADS